jgi:hypothetical protein
MEEMGMPKIGPHWLPCSKPSQGVSDWNFFVILFQTWSKAHEPKFVPKPIRFEEDIEILGNGGLVPHSLPPLNPSYPHLFSFILP